MDEFLQGVPQPDDLWKFVLNALFGPGIALAAYLLYVLVTAWLGTIRSTVALARWLGGVARDARVRLVEMSATQITAALGLSALLALVLCGWLVGVLVIGNLISFAYRQSGHDFLELQTRDAASLVDWLQWNTFTKAYLIAALAVLLIAVVSRGAPNVRFLAFLIGIPTMPWGFSIAVLTVFEIILGCFAWLATGTYSAGEGFAWHLVFAAIIAAYLGTSVLALRAGRALGRLWLARE
ncbi:hypothetical protein ACFV0T_26795 [Streptomyces sp. NPDC059582]|uniref:hypothetical protein n=1 Tax=Streptomyces sp. NPDC059582 TaxID=3346875 RepID=UPI0036BA29FB